MPWRRAIASTRASAPSARPVGALPRGQEAREGRGVDGLDLLAECARAIGAGVLRSTSTSHHSRSTPPGRNSPRDDAALGLERVRARRAPARRRRRAVPATSSAVERAVRSGVSCDEPLERAVGRFGEDARQADRQRGAEARRAGPRGVLDRGEPVLAGDLDPDRTAAPRASRRARPARRASARAAISSAREVAEIAEQVVRARRRSRVPAVGRGAGARARARRAPAGRSARAAPRRRAARAAGRGRARAPRPDARRAARRPRTCRPRPSRTAATARTATPCAVSTGDRSGPCATGGRASTSRSAGRSNTSRRHSRVVSSRIGNVGCIAAATSSRSAARWRCCHSGVRCPGRGGGGAGRGRRPRGTRSRTARSRAGRRPRAPRSRRGRTARSSTGIRVLGLGEAHDDPVVAPQHLHVEPEPLEQALLDRERPRRVHAWPERREEAHAPVADLVAEPLDHDRAVVGHGPGRLGLLVEVRDEVAGGALVEPERRAGASRRRARARSPRSSRVNAPIARPSSIGRPGLSPFQNGILPGSPGAGTTTTRSYVMSSIRHDDAPSMKTSPLRDLVDHLLVELADARAVGQEHAEQAAVGDRARRGDREPPRALARAHRAAGAIPHEPRAELRELVGRVPAGEQVEHGEEDLVARGRRSSRRGGRARPRSSTGHSSTAHIATICCASTSSGFRG